MKFDISKQWCERMAKNDIGHSVTAGIRSKKYELCSFCRGFDLERQWCDHCNKSGIILVDSNQDAT